MNPGGSVKERIGLRMIEDAEARGELLPGDILIEPTSGNTGIGLALAAAVKGYRCIITLPEKMSKEKVDVLKALGAEIIRTPTTAKFDSPESHFGVAKRLVQELPRAHILDQYRNPSNPLAHYDGTAEEILEACNGKVDMLVATAGTGGTISGIARKIKERCPNCKVIGVDPVGSIMAAPDEINVGGVRLNYEVEGIGYDFIPTVCERKYIDQWYKTDDKATFQMARRLIRDEGILCGGSSGAAMSGALRAAADHKLGRGQKVVVILPDSIRNYMSKFLTDEWMAERKFIEVPPKSPVSWWWEKPLSVLQLEPTATIQSTVTTKDAIKLLRNNGLIAAPVVDQSQSVVGVLSVSNTLSLVAAGKLKLTDSVEAAVKKDLKQVSVDSTLGSVSVLLSTQQFALVASDQQNNIDSGKLFLVTDFDLIDFISNNGADCSDGSINGTAKSYSKGSA
jgi:cystathionine beta-synthase